MFRKFVDFDGVYYNLDHIISVDERNRRITLSNNTNVELTFGEMQYLLSLINKK